MSLLTSPGLRGLVVILAVGAMPPLPRAAAQSAPNPVAVALHTSALTGIRITDAEMAAIRRRAERDRATVSQVIHGLEEVQASQTVETKAYEEAARALTERRDEEARNAAEAARLK
ncbi:MAG: hypothetical protein E8D45_07500, partial [Nitrospira sp.]